MGGVFTKSLIWADTLENKVKINAPVTYFLSLNENVFMNTKLSLIDASSASAIDITVDKLSTGRKAELVIHNFFGKQFVRCGHGLMG